MRPSRSAVRRVARSSPSFTEFPGWPATRTSPASAGSGTATTWPGTRKTRRPSGSRRESRRRPGRQARARRRLRRRALFAAAGQPRGTGHRRRPERGRREGRSLCADLPDVAIVQADLLDLPLADAAFDLVFSIGVLHHTPDPRRAFGQIAGEVKPGGRLAVWLYRKNTPPQEWLNTGLRALTTRLPARVLEPLCAGLGVLGSVPLLNRTLNKVANFSSHPDWTLRVCDNFDWYAPRYQSHHTVDELKSWFAEEGFDDLTELAPPSPAGSTTGPTTTT